MGTELEEAARAYVEARAAFDRTSFGPERAEARAVLDIAWARLNLMCGYQECYDKKIFQMVTEPRPESTEALF